MDRSEIFFYFFILFLFIRTDDDLDNYKTTSSSSSFYHSMAIGWMDHFFHQDKGRVNIKSFYHNKKVIFYNGNYFFARFVWDVQK
jgi:hypothetical protein